MQTLETKTVFLEAINLPFRKVSGCPLGTNDLTLFLHVSLDPKEAWQNGIFHNSRYGIFRIGSDFSIELLSKGFPYKVGSFRKCKAKSLADVAARINKWAAENSSI